MDYKCKKEILHIPSHSIPTYWLHVGTKQLEPTKFKPIRNIPFFCKPFGGIWASPLQLNNRHLSDWLQFFDEAMNDSQIKTKENAVLFSFKRSARIYVINSQQDLIHLYELIGAAQQPFEMPFSTYSYLDYEKVKEHFDVLYLTKNGEGATRLPLYNSEYNLYGWDCESCLVLNYDVINKQMPLSITT